MYRLDKIDLQLVHVVPAIERLGAAAGGDAGASSSGLACSCTCRASALNDTYSRSSFGQALSVQVEDRTGMCISQRCHL